IRGEHHDGHRFISELYKAGIRQFIVEKDLPIHQFSDANFLKVDSAIGALQKIASHHRSQFSLPVIGITGSNGKTIIKEWLYQLLSRDFTIVKNPGSYNSQLGVPLSVWPMQAHHSLGIFEAGISKPGEMELLEKIIKPSIGIFTNIGTAHDENFRTVNDKVDEKLKLFARVERLIYCKDHAIISEAVHRAKIPSLSWGSSAQSDIQISKTRDSYTVTTNGKTFSVTFPFSDHASVENAFHCIALMLLLDINPASIQERINSLRSVPMRLELKEGINQCQVIDDTYNNDLAGLQISLDFLNHQNQKANKTLILSDVLQSGLSEDELTNQVAQIVNQSGLKKFIGIGAALSNHSGKFKLSTRFFSTTDDFLNSPESSSFQQEMILVKGARSFQFEKIVSHLQRKVHGTVMEVDLGALIHNLNYFKAKLKPTTKVMVMVKAFAYGSGSTEVANVLQYHKVDYLGVAYADEGVELRKNNITLPIMVMNPSEEGFHAMITNNLEPEIYGFKILNEFISFLSGRPWKVHIKLDTGMHRLGFEEQNLKELTAMLTKNKNLEIASIFTHLAGSDEAEHDAFSKQQAETFMSFAKALAKNIGYNPILHVLNTPGILRLPEWQLNMVRLGVGLYGVNPTNNNHSLKTVSTLKTVISQIKKIRPGETIGYGRKGKATNEMTLATIAVGYADGYSRAFSGGVGEVLVRGKRAPVVGNVCMDMTMID
ncbi:MAG TPA: bifunctional UDP-N-acetylmuramoyl-tripeptide:D-alanyl-D-alanine ligase/alanine racemase, partial [Cyclobacteriaceae bacterium]